MRLEEKLIKLRKQKGLTQQGLAEKINYSDKVISKWENGYSLPDMQAMAILANFYNISVDEMINDCELINVKEKKTFPLIPKILFHIILLFAPIMAISYVLGFFNPNLTFRLVATWDAVVPIILGFILIVLSLIDLIFTYLNISRKVVVCCIFATICTLLIFALIALGMYGQLTSFTKPFIYLVISIIISTAYGFLFNKKC